MALRLTPQKREFFVLFTQASSNARDIARALVELLDEWPDNREKLRDIRELEHEGLLTSRRGGGTRVTASGRAPAMDRRQLLAGMATDFVARARSLGFTDEEIVVALERQLPL